MTFLARRMFGLKAAGTAIGALGVLGLLIGVWTGVHIRSHPEPAGGVALHTPVGEASPSTAADAAGGAGGAGGAGVDGMPHMAGKVPALLPDFTLSDRHGKVISVATWSGKSLVLNFWATWCAPCRREIPLLKSLSIEWEQRKVEVIGVAVDYSDKVATFSDELKIPYPILVGEQDALDVAARFGVDSPVFPFTVFTDRRGEVVTLYVGELHRAQADLILLAVQNVNDNQLSLAEAQRHIAAGLRALTAIPG